MKIGLLILVSLFYCLEIFASTNFKYPSFSCKYGPHSGKKIEKTIRFSKNDIVKYNEEAFKRTKDRGASCGICLAGKPTLLNSKKGHLKIRKEYMGFKPRKLIIHSIDFKGSTKFTISLDAQTKEFQTEFFLENQELKCQKIEITDHFIMKCAFFIKTKASNKQALYIGEETKSINLKYDFGIDFPINKKWKSKLKGLSLMASSHYPKKGWAGFALVKRGDKVQNDYFSIPMREGQRFSASRIFDHMVASADCSILK